MRIAPVAYGFDSTSAPTAAGPASASAGDRVRAMHSYVYEHTNLRIAGGYLTGTGPSWHPVFESLWLAGWGLSLFDNAMPQSGGANSEFERFDTASGTWVFLGGTPLPFHFPTSADGEAHARDVVARRTTARLSNLDRAVVYIDNEDSNPGTRHNQELHDVPPFAELSDAQRRFSVPGARIRVNQGGFADMLAFYRGLFGWLERQPPGVVTIRPGLYVHLPVVGALLAEFPYLHICDNIYHRGPPPTLTALDPDSTWRPRPDRLEWTVSRHNAHAERDSRSRAPATTAARGPTSAWRAWPAVYQFEGTNGTPLFGGTVSYPFGGTSYTVNFRPTTWLVDSEASLVDDPAYPVASPRLAAGTGDPVPLVYVDRIRNSRMPSAARERLGRLSVENLTARGAPAGPTSFEGEPAFGTPSAVEPGTRPVWLRNVLVSAQRARGGWGVTLQAHRLAGGVLTPHSASILDPADALRPHSRWTGAACDDQNAALFVADTDGTLRVTHARPDAPRWPRTSTVEPRLVHPYSQLRAGSRDGRSIDVFFVDGTRCLHTAWWDPRLRRAGHRRIDTQDNRLLPTTALAVASPDPSTLVVAAVGYDLRLHVAAWSAASGLWQVPSPVGNELLCPHTDLAAAWNPDRLRVEVLALAHDLRVCLYELSSHGTGWAATGPPAVLFTPAVGGARRFVPSVPDLAADAPNPYGDLALAISPNRPRFRLAATACTGVFGPSTQWTTSPAGAAPPTPSAWQSRMYDPPTPRQ